MADKNRNYEIGHGKPPKDHQWAKGQSGNPKGRPKAAKGLKTILAKEVYTRQTIKIAGEPVTGPRLQLTILTLATRAAAGDMKAADRLLPLVIQILGGDDGADAAKRLSAQDQALLDEWLGSVNPEPAEQLSSNDEGLSKKFDDDDDEGDDHDPQEA